jgi:hypothetical protein
LASFNDASISTSADRRHALVKQRRIRHDNRIARQLLLVTRDERIEAVRPDLFLAFDEELHVDRAFAMLQVRLERIDVHDELPFVVGSAAGVDPTADHRRLEGRCLPQLDRIDRLNVVVAVDQYRRFPGGTEPLAVDDRVPVGLVQLDASTTGAVQPTLHPLRSLAHVLRVLGLGAHRRDLQQLF